MVLYIKASYIKILANTNKLIIILVFWLIVNKR